MFDHRFFASQTGAAALISIVAMAAFTLFAFSQQADAAPSLMMPDMMPAAIYMVELA